MNPEDRLIVALDVDRKERALGFVGKLKKNVRTFKVGLELFLSCGPTIVEDVKREGCDVFLDLKFHDIPNTVAKAAISITRLAPLMFNVHGLGGYDTMKRTLEAVEKEAKRLKIPRPKILAVTILTSMDENGLKNIGISDNIQAEVLRLARLARDASLDGVVASPHEIKPIREIMGKEFLIVTPGVRPSWAEAGDQKRIMTPGEAITLGADYIVVGRPIIEAQDPVEAAKKILNEMK